MELLEIVQKLPQISDLAGVVYAIDLRLWDSHLPQGNYEWHSPTSIEIRRGLGEMSR